MKKPLRCSITLLVLVACSCISVLGQGTSKYLREANRAVKSNDYPGACLNSMEVLKQNPKKKPAQEILSRFYPLAVDDLKSSIEDAKANSKEIENEGNVKLRMKIVENYETLNELDKKLETTQKLVKNSKFPLDHPRADYTAQLEKAVQRMESGKDSLAEMLYQEGAELVAMGGKANCKEGALRFKKIQSYRPGFKDSQDQYLQARELGTLVVGVMDLENHSSASTAGDPALAFSNKLREQLGKEMAGKEFMRLAGATEMNQMSLVAQNGPGGGVASGVDVLVLGALNNLSVVYGQPKTGQPRTDEAEVTIRYEYYTDSKGKKKKRPVKGKVYATHQTIERSVTSHVGGKLEVVHEGGAETILTREINGSHVWSHCWKTYTGNIEAVPFYGCGEKDIPSPTEDTMLLTAMDNCISALAKEIVHALE